MNKMSVRILDTVCAGILALGLGFMVSCARIEDESTVGHEPQGGGLDDGQLTQVAVNFSVKKEDFDEQQPAGEVERSNPAGNPAVYSILNPGVGTDEGTSTGYVPQDVWVIQFGGTGDEAPLVGLPRYTELSGATNIQVVASKVANTLVFVANTHDSNLEWGDISTLSKMKLAHKKIEKESHCYGNNLHSINDLILSGIYTAEITTKPISTELFRAITRIDFKLTNAPGSTMTLRSIQLCNVPTNLYYTGAIATPGNIFPTTSPYFDYPQEPLPEALQEHHLTFYTPLNQQGTSPGSTSPKTKNAQAPGNATFLKIIATDPQGQAYIYRIYPGANQTNDYNLRPNHRYTLALTINAPGDEATDGRVQSYTPTDLPSSNCYILNPPPPGTAPRIFTIPIDRVNQFWADQDATLMISQSDTWIAEHIWQDTPTPGIIQFLDPITGLPLETFTARGGDQPIRLSIPPGAEGNILIGIKKTGPNQPGYLWSWHLWITDYDPQYGATPRAGIYAYRVPGGEVHRYEGTLWTGPTAIYKDKYIMDRNLGASHTLLSPTGNMHYQFGRKDPMPNSRTGNHLYYANGTIIPASDPRNAITTNKNAGTGVSLATGVLNPTTFYYKDIAQGLGDWTSQGLLAPHPWNHPTPGILQKSFYDPCPPGWQLPQIGIWHNFVYSPTNPALATAMNVNRDPKLGWFYGSSIGGRYWPLGSPVTSSIHYPAYGYRNATNGSHGGYSGQGHVWSANPANAIGGHDLYVNSLNVYLNYSDQRSHGMPVRCVQQ